MAKLLVIAGMKEAKTKNGELMFVGDLGNQLRLLMMANKFRTQDNHPEWNLMITTAPPRKRKPTTEGGSPVASDPKPKKPKKKTPF